MNRIELNCEIMMMRIMSKEKIEQNLYQRKDWDCGQDNETDTFFRA